MGRSIPNNEVIAICEQLGLAPLILNLQEGYETILNPEAGALNRSMVTLILIARALLSKPLLLLWDTHYQHLTQIQQTKVFGYIENNCKCTVILSATNETLHNQVSNLLHLAEG
jgi:ABC-type bacteriocin/lantibiotic exporter with double-glycine peptidase domain